MTETKPTTLDAEPQLVCMLCGSTGELQTPELADRHFGAPGTWSHLLCPQCGLVWLNPRPCESDLPKLYADYYTHAATTEGSRFLQAIALGVPVAAMAYDDIALEPAVRRGGALLSHVGPIREMGRRGVMGLEGGERGRLLDFGCGDGAFLEHMRSLGWSITGVELDPRAAQAARETLDADVVHPSIEAALDANPEGFDAITLSHVIEHLLDPVATLRACGNALRGGGTLVITTPNTRSRAHARFGRNWLHLDPPRHIHLFDPSTLTELVRQAGLRIERVETPTSSYHFVHQASALLERRGSLPGIRVEDVSLTVLVESAVFWMWEYALTRCGMDCGEEIMLRATVSEEHRQAPEEAAS
ncbi:MAG: class I SAM-dependent methyltransferase [Myxococcota bacterium]|jgi:2-polyprenyl-3-methyl-5-hydroxy-6-metoxy-1,4-benzoquinol methylase|nr:class I SAM-dependent methyltransferase [Myxococcota bacterium]